jgi:uncharacterized Zn finger protein
MKEAIMALNDTRPMCPNCTMGMIVTQGFKLECEHKTFECLRCGQVRGQIQQTQAVKQPFRRAG